MIPIRWLAHRKQVSTLRNHRRWAVFELPRAGMLFLLTVEVVTLLAVLAVWTHASADATPLARLGTLLALSLVYAEVTDRVERLWVWLHADQGAWVGQTSILLFVGVLALPTWAALAQAVIAYAHIGLRNKRHATAPAHRWVWSATTVVLGTLASSYAFHWFGGNAEQVGVLDLLAILGAAALYSGVNLAVLIVGMYLALRPPSVRELLPDRNQVSYEAAKLLLGVVGCVLLVHAVFLFPAVMVFGAMLHRSTLVGELRAVASTDVKTGLLTFRAWSEQAEGSLARCERTGQPASLVLLDLDHFKRLNDTHGHSAGDRALARIGAILIDEIRTRDCVGRYGGEEFVVFLPGTTEAQAVEIAQRLRERIASNTTSAAVTASLGVAAIGPNRVTLGQLIDAADAAMYEAKERGRNTVCTASTTSAASTA